MRFKLFLRVKSGTEEKIMAFKKSRNTEVQVVFFKVSFMNVFRPGNQDF